MIIQTRTFPFSKRFLTGHRRSMYILAVTSIIPALFISLIEEGIDTHRLWASRSLIPLFVDTILVFAAFMIMFIVIIRYVSNQWRQSTLHIGPEGLVREAGRLRQVVTWGRITKVRIGHNPGGEPRRIKVFTANGQPLVLFGFESMPEIAGLISNGLSPTAQVEIKRHWLDWENPLVTAATLVPGMLAFMLALEIIRRLGGQVETVFALLSMAIGIYSLSYGALSRTNPILRISLFVICIVILVGEILTLMSR